MDIQTNREDEIIFKNRALVDEVKGLMKELINIGGGYYQIGDINYIEVGYYCGTNKNMLALKKDEHAKQIISRLEDLGVLFGFILPYPNDTDDRSEGLSSRQGTLF